jgi:hypothetical protein
MVLPDPLEEWDETELNDTEWLRSFANNPAFAFLKDTEEDIYTLLDGKPLQETSLHSPPISAADRSE